MQSTQRSLPRDVFVHMLMVATLYASVAAFLTLIFQYANVLFPDALGAYYPGILDTIRQSEATLLIVFPVFLFLSWLIGRDIASDPALRDFKLRKWLIYFTLFISAITIIIDLVVLIYNFLGGELTTPFVLKIAAVLATAAAIFGYYLWDLRLSAQAGADALTRSRVPRVAASLAATVVLAALVAGFFVVGSPASQRSRRFDEQRIQHLQTLQSQIVNYWMLKQKLPDALDALRDSISGFIAPVDPESRAAYAYRATARLSFELCAVFGMATVVPEDGRAKSFAVPVPYPYGAYGGAPADNWSHDAGRVCFSRTIDPELYKPQKLAPAGP